MEIFGRGIGEGAVGIQGHAAVRRRRPHDITQLLVIRVRGHNRPAHRLLFGGAQGDIAGARHIIHRRHADGYRASGATTLLAVTHRHREAVAAVEIFGRGVGEGAVGIQGHAAVRRVRAQGVAQAVTIQIGGDDAAGDGGVFVGVQAQISARRRVVDRSHANAHRAGDCPTIAVADGDREAVVAVEIGSRRVGK